MIYPGRESRHLEFKSAVPILLPDLSPIHADEDNLLKLFSLQKEVCIRDVMQGLKVSRNTATRKLAKLTAEGKLVRIGKGPAVRYILSQQ